MGDELVRRMNLDTERFSSELEDIADPQLRGTVNEFGFELARAAHEKNIIESGNLPADTQQRCLEIAFARIAHYERLAPQSLPPLLAKEQEEAHRISESTLAFLSYLLPSGPIIFSPSFKGCGFVDSCHGDLIDGTTLCEVKAGSRNFRLADLRQLLTYATLNKLSPVTEITHLALVNPRRGVFYRDTFDAIAWAASGRSASDLASSITDVMSGAGSSR